jgi:hypothetical protein
LVSRKQSVPNSLPKLLTKLQKIPTTNFLPQENTNLVATSIGESSTQSEEDTVMDLEYSGDWSQGNITNPTLLFDYFTETSGFAMFTGHLENSNSQTEDVILIEMFNGQYVDKKTCNNLYQLH